MDVDDGASPDSPRPPVETVALVVVASASARAEYFQPSGSPTLLTAEYAITELLGRECDDAVEAPTIAARLGIAAQLAYLLVQHLEAVGVVTMIACGQISKRGQIQQFGAVLTRNMRPALGRRQPVTPAQLCERLAQCSGRMAVAEV